MLSRLKGIETYPPASMARGLVFNFGYAFPFEGNWNLQTLLGEALRALLLSLDMLSRLKGIETIALCMWHWSSLADFGYAFPFEGNWNTPLIRFQYWQRSNLWICFPVWRELKRLPDPRHGWQLFLPLDMLSRLKGIETVPVQTIAPLLFPLDMLSRLKGIETNSATASRGLVDKSFGYAFPFEGNWNEIQMILLTKVNTLHFGYAFPFEGNWNFRHWIQPRIHYCLFGYAFPFEGNWNICALKSLSDRRERHLWICFPVWRELKLEFPRVLQNLHLHLWICFPVWRELKLIVEPS